MLNLELLLLLVPVAGSGESPTNAAASESAATPTILALDDKPVLHKWIGGLSASAIVTDGNTKTRSANAQFDALYRRENDRTTFGGWWNYQDDKTGVLQRRTGLKAQYDYFFSEKTYGLAQTSIESDANADLERRWIAGVGAGRQFLEDTVRKFSAEAGIAWFDEHFNNSPSSDYFTARLAYKYDRNLNKDWVFFNGGELYPSLENANDVYAKVDTRLKVTLSDQLYAQGQWVMDWDNTPAGANERIDNRYIISIGWTF